MEGAVAMRTGGEEMKESGHKIFIGLHILLMFYSLTGICSKLAAGTKIFSIKFFLYYGSEVVLFSLYALFWQQIIKRLPLTAAFANKSVTVIWGIVWGALVFHEPLTRNKVLGAVLVVAGVILYSAAGKEDMDGT